MRYVKIMGLAAVAAAVLTALVGSSAASATVLCKTKPTTGGGSTTGTTCPEGWAYSAGTKNHAVSKGKVVLDVSFGNIECENSTIEGEFANEGNATETVKGPVNTMTLTGCNCEVKVLKAGTQEVHWIPDTVNATITGSGQEITALCNTIFGSVHCIYVSNNSDFGVSTGSETAAILDTSSTMERSPTNALCEEEATLTATYETTTPKPLWFAAHT